eukprot:CAMPEP_0181330046 /NCGR_PEP_ID=MMETSP1101-20121128/23671_1 /TAXON_ID=46948 /ORGANISM="Rhodomonas abbreviata, Strain Caron Lab Isolate" /LENGTH=279 /DNA_ID=CAMNT_0023439237 /DNA_START=10 /DNA_END=849 /DNA_ORIENTATION=+
MVKLSTVGAYALISCAAVADAFAPGPALALGNRGVARSQTPSSLCMTAIPDRRSVIKAGVAGAATLALGIVPAMAEEEWMEVDDGKGKTYWYNTKTQKTSATKPGDEAAPAAKAEGGAEGPEPVKVSKMGGLLTQYKDINKGFSILRPNGWNQFESQPGEYDVKWEDIVEKSELLMVGSSPVKTATSVSALGDVAKVGASLAAKKKAELVDAKERTVENIQYYTYIFKQGDEKRGAREVYQLCVSKGRLWSVTATTAEKRWAKRTELFNNVMLSFRPRL